MSDLKMESVGSYGRHGSHSTQRHDHDSDEFWEDLRRPLVATAEDAAGGGSSTQRIRVSAIAELKEFAGKNDDEDRARAWISKVKSAFLRDQAPDPEKCLVFGDLLTGPDRNCYTQLSRRIRNSWKSL